MNNNKKGVATKSETKRLKGRCDLMPRKPCCYRQPRICVEDIIRFEVNWEYGGTNTSTDCITAGVIIIPCVLPYHASIFNQLNMRNIHSNYRKQKPKE